MIRSGPSDDYLLGHRYAITAYTTSNTNIQLDLKNLRIEQC